MTRNAVLIDRGTGLYVGWYFWVRALDEVNRSARYGSPFGLLFLEAERPSTLSRKALAEALGKVAARSVVAIGRGDWTGPRPSNVRLEPEIPQQELLNTAKVFVTHAGYSGVREALTAGVPMVCLPLFADQPRNAARIQDLETGVRVDVKGLTASVLAERIQHVLDTRTYCDAAEKFSGEMADLPVFTSIPDHLVSAV